MKIRLLCIILCLTISGCKKEVLPWTGDAINGLSHFRNNEPDNAIKLKAQQAWFDWMHQDLTSRPYLLQVKFTDVNENHATMHLFISSVGNRFDGISVIECGEYDGQLKFSSEPIFAFRGKGIKTGWNTVPVEFRKGKEKNNPADWNKPNVTARLKISRPARNKLVSFIIWDTDARCSDIFSLDPNSIGK